MGLGVLSDTYTSSFSGSVIIPFSSSQITWPTPLQYVFSGYNYLLSPHTASNELLLGITSSVNNLVMKISSTPSSLSSPYSNLSYQFLPSPFYGFDDMSRFPDCQPLVGNIDNNRKNPLIQKVDYNSGQIVPTNILAISSGSATKVSIPESNYTLLKSKNPRYDGVKTTSQILNKWSAGDTNTYGKEPTVESLTNLMTFCSWINNAFPERNNTLEANIKYVMKDDESVNEPNLTEKSITNVQFSFPQQQKLHYCFKG